MISFKSKVTKSILNYYFLNPDAVHYVNELAKILKADAKNMHRKLEASVSLSQFQGFGSGGCSYWLTE